MKMAKKSDYGYILLFRVKKKTYEFMDDVCNAYTVKNIVDLT